MHECIIYNLLQIREKSKDANETVPTPKVVEKFKSILEIRSESASFSHLWHENIIK